MKFLVCVLFAALVGQAFEELTAQPAHFQNLLYKPPPPKPPPRPIRVRRQVLSGSVASNPKSGSDVNLKLSQGIGTPDHNVIGSVLAGGNTDHGPVTTGGALSYNNNGHGVGLTSSHTPGGTDSFGQSAHVNLFNTKEHNLDAIAFASQNKQPNGFQFDRNGVGLDYNHANGHGASISHINEPGFGRQLKVGGRANLWTSPDRHTRLDLTGSGSQWLSGPLSGHRDYSTGLGLRHYFR